jgi:hypothetical protein
MLARNPSTAAVSSWGDRASRLIAVPGKQPCFGGSPLHTRRLPALVLVLALALAQPPLAAFAQQPGDWDVPSGHFYAQTGGSAGLGYVVSDEGGIAFRSAFQRLGGVPVLGYPVSQRFEHGGFVTQAMQKAVFQWRPDTAAVAFVDVFDDLSAAGKDETAPSETAARRRST